MHVHAYLPHTGLFCLYKGLPGTPEHCQYYWDGQNLQYSETCLSGHLNTVVTFALWSAWESPELKYNTAIYPHPKHSKLYNTTLYIMATIHCT